MKQKGSDGGMQAARNARVTLITDSMRSDFDDPGILHVLDQSQWPYQTRI